MNKVVKKEIEFAGRKLTLETGELAQQANMAVRAQYGDTVVLATVVSAEPKVDIDYFPLSVNYVERLYASGTIKSGKYVKRDGHPTDEAIVNRRLVDHAIRPLFPQDEGYRDEVQVALYLLSLDKDADPEFVNMVAASAVLHASDIPWSGPMASARVGMVDGSYVLNPSLDALKTSHLNLLVSFVGKEKRFLAMEAEAHMLPEEEVLGAIKHAHDNLDPVLDLIEDFAQEVNPGLKKYAWVSHNPAKEVIDGVSEVAKDRVVEMIEGGLDKEARKARAAEIVADLYSKFEGKFKKVDMDEAFDKLQKKALEHLILDKGKRPDGRAIDEIRPLSGSVGVLPRVHGSGIFTRGQTQVLNVTTLAALSEAQTIQDVFGERTKRYLHFYWFPPFSTGETGRMGVFPGSREVGHGMLAERALLPVIPDAASFPYTIMLQSETLASNGSSSMASTCASSLSLMDAGVPIKAPVAGIGVGLIVNDDFSKYQLLTDIAGLEDGSGYMDFKMTGTREGVTAIQVDIKAKGLGMEMLPEIFKRSHDARMKVLDFMDTVIAESRGSVSEYAPKTAVVKIQPDQIGMVIGSGGKTIKQIQEDTGTTLSIEDDGTVVISGVGNDGINKAKEIVENMTRVIEPGEIFDGVVEEIMPYGAFVEILPGKTGLLHVSEISNEFVDKVEDHLSVGQTVKVKVLEVSRDGKYSLSIKALTGGSNDDGQFNRTERPDRPRGGFGGGNRGGFDRGGRGGGRGGDRGGRGGFNRGGRR